MKKLLLLLAGLSMAGNMLAQNGIITEQPAGTLRTFHGYSFSYYAGTWGYAASDYHDGLARQVVFADNGVDVYFKDPLSRVNHNVWIKGTLNDGIITVDTPQKVRETEKNGVTTEWFVERLIPEITYNSFGEERITWVIDSVETKITYAFRNDSIIQTEQNVMLGLVADGQYQVYGDVNVVYTAVNEHAAVLPEDKAEAWTMRYKDTYAQQATLAIDNDDVYISGFWPEQPAATIKGKIEGDKVIVPNGQYLGFLNDSYYTYFMTTMIDRSSWVAKYTTIDQPLEFAFDKEEMSLTPLFAEEIVPVVRYGKSIGATDQASSLLFVADKMSFKKQTELGAPANPTFQIESGCFRRYPDYNWGYVIFNVPNLDVNGNALKTELLYYSIYLDDEVLVIDPADANFPENYKGIDTPITEIPFNFDNGDGITQSGSMAGRYVKFFHLDFDEIGIQSIYKGADKEYRSLIAYYNPTTREVRYADSTTGLGATAISGEVAGVVRYDLFGREVSDSYKGMVIEAVRYTDGSVKTTKKIVR